MTLNDKVSRQIAAGFSPEEVLDNLKDEPYSRQEILAAYQRMAPTVPQSGSSGINWRTVLSIVIALFALIRIIIRLSR